MADIERFAQVVSQANRGLVLQVVVRGSAGAVSFDVLTKWEKWPYRAPWFEEEGVTPRCDTVERHTTVPEGTDRATRCDLSPSGWCDHDGSSLLAEEWWPAFVGKGTEAIYPRLESIYRKWLEVCDGNRDA